MVWVGWDYRIYVANAQAFWSGDPEAIYDPGENLASGEEIPEVPYPPLFAWLVTPFTWLPHDVGFAVWTALNGLAARGRAAPLRSGGGRLPSDRSDTGRSGP